MKVVVTASGPELDSQVDPRFGRADFFVVVDTETMEAEGFENPNKSLGGGAGVQSAQFIASKGVQAVLTGNCGPNAYATLEAAEVQVITGASGTVRQAVETFREGNVESGGGPNVASHFGTGGPGAAGPGAGGGMPPGAGRGMGRGGGRGMGRGGGRGMGRGVAPMQGAPGAGAGPGAQQPPAGQGGGRDEMEILKQQARALQQQLEEINRRIEELSENQ